MLTIKDEVVKQVKNRFRPGPGFICDLGKYEKFSKNLNEGVASYIAYAGLYHCHQDEIPGVVAGLVACAIQYIQDHFNEIVKTTSLLTDRQHGIQNSLVNYGYYNQQPQQTIPNALNGNFRNPQEGAQVVAYLRRETDDTERAVQTIEDIDTQVQRRNLALARMGVAFDGLANSVSELAVHENQALQSQARYLQCARLTFFPKAPPMQLTAPPSSMPQNVFVPPAINPFY